MTKSYRKLLSEHVQLQNVQLELQGIVSKINEAINILTVAEMQFNSDTMSAADSSNENTMTEAPTATDADINQVQIDLNVPMKSNMEEEESDDELLFMKN